MKSLKSVAYWGSLVLVSAALGVVFFALFVAPYFGLVWQFIAPD